MILGSHLVKGGWGFVGTFVFLVSWFLVLFGVFFVALFCFVGTDENPSLLLADQILG